MFSCRLGHNQVAEMWGIKGAAEDSYAPTGSYVSFFDAQQPGACSDRNSDAALKRFLDLITPADRLLIKWLEFGHKGTLGEDLLQPFKVLNCLAKAFRLLGT